MFRTPPPQVKALCCLCPQNGKGAGTISFVPAPSNNIISGFTGNVRLPAKILWEIVAIQTYRKDQGENSFIYTIKIFSRPSY
ncbi:hypothetical protein AXF09_13590 [Ruminococcus sp. DSM 100440]|nr:hypothetical protein AXF09_13590 [Ruminococcus sp. DSM 100440]